MTIQTFALAACKPALPLPLAAALLAALLLPGAAQALAAPVVADAHLAATNVGAAQTITVNATTKGVLRFDLSGLPLNTVAADIGKASLVFFAKSITRAGPVQVRAVAPGTAWTESTVTAAGAAAWTLEGTPAASGTVNRANTYYTVDVTGLLHSVLPAGATSVDLVVETPGGQPTALSFDSKESVQTGHAAYLDLHLVTAPASIAASIVTGVLGDAQVSNNLTIDAGSVAASVISGVLPVGSGGTGAGSLTGYLVGNGTGPVIASATIPASAISGNFGTLRADSIIGGDSGNAVTAGVTGAFIGGGGIAASGDVNAVTDSYGVVGGGVGNRAGDNAGTTFDSGVATVAGGYRNTASGFGSAVAGGYRNTASGEDSAVAGGYRNTASGDNGTVAGGAGNTASGFGSAVLGGENSTASGGYSAVVAGFNTEAGGSFSFAGGRQAKVGATHNGAFLWSGSLASDFASAAANEFAVRATGGVRFRTNSALSTGCSIAAGGGSWSCTSDRAAKEDFAPVDGRAVLDKVAALPIQTWSYKTEATHSRHMGPMAQDFRAAFGLGEDDKTIATVDPDGVALAAIQGLNALVQEQRKLIEAQRAALQAQQAEIAALRDEGRQVAERLHRVEANFVYTAW